MLSKYEFWSFILWSSCSAELPFKASRKCAQSIAKIWDLNFYITLWSRLYPFQFLTQRTQQGWNHVQCKNSLFSKSCWNNWSIVYVCFCVCRMTYFDENKRLLRHDGLHSSARFFNHTHIFSWSACIASILVRLWHENKIPLPPTLSE